MSGLDTRSASGPTLPELQAELTAVLGIVRAAARADRGLDDLKRFQMELRPERWLPLLERLAEDHEIVEWLEGLNHVRGRLLYADPVKKRFACAATFTPSGGVVWNWGSTLRQAWREAQIPLDPHTPPPGEA